MDIGNGSAPGAEEDPAAAFLVQHHNEIEGIEKEQEVDGILGTEGLQSPEFQGSMTGEVTGEVDAVNGDSCQENDADAYSTSSQADQLHQEPDSIRKWREEQIKHLAELDANSREAELEWKEKAKKELEDWYIQQAEHLEEMKTNNSTNIKQHCYNLQQAAEVSDVNEGQEVVAGSEWEHVLHLCDLNSKTSKVSKDVSRMRSVLVSLSQVPLALK
ncbi:clathrin light chain A-like isoform X2 [Carcharodon carcharias]|uniref:clathrin light chain A-like isoform X2 n=1 Tax=Carcharodon carcharias TaxID=13397 RepID=UPI001B7EBE52|nr:clathrin light chain A-like isoform X2 [Carcharodon carcharias]